MSDFPPGDPDNDRITGVKERATVGPKVSGLPGEPDYQGITVFWFVLVPGFTV